MAGLKDPDVRLRRNVVLAFGALSGGWWSFECGPAKIDIRLALPALVDAFRDSDKDVAGWAAQAVGNMGASATSAVSPLIGLLTASDKGGRMSACMALGQIGPGARAALPALRVALSDPMVSGCAARSIQRIEQWGADSRTSKTRHRDAAWKSASLSCNNARHPADRLTLHQAASQHAGQAVRRGSRADLSIVSY